MGLTLNVQRHKAAIRRSELSLPIKCLLRDQILIQTHSVFDFGCGHGEDIVRLRRIGFKCDGWDPSLRIDRPKITADVVNLGYVLNVIEDVVERATCLQEAWGLARRILVVSARIMVGGAGKAEVEYGDGIITQIGTFQKFYGQSELRDYIQATLGVDAFPAAPGVFYVFRDETLREQFLANRYRRRSAAPSKRHSEVRFETHREILEPLIEWIGEQGRIPEPDEFSSAAAIIAEFGSIKRAFALIQRVTGTDEWEQIRKRRTEDLLVAMALANFGRRPRQSDLPQDVLRDIQAFFGSYKRAREQADELLFRVGDPDAIDEACRRSPLGKLLPNALYIHRSALEELEPLLRVYEGCGRAYLGEIEEANLIKLHRLSGKISYLAYPDFETDPHPVLSTCVKLNMRSRQIDFYDYRTSENPPVLHRKETFLAPTHPEYTRFARLTQQEVRHGLLDETATIGTRSGWQTRLTETGFRLAGHRLMRVKQ